MTRVVSLALGLVACGTTSEKQMQDTGISCEERLDDLIDCTPAYEPTYAEVFENTLRPSCGKTGVSCHAEGRQAGLGFVDAEQAYRDLHETSVVQAGAPACSRLVARLRETDPKLRMPPGRALDAAEVCAIVRWIERGALP